MEILFIGGVFRKDKQKEILRKSKSGVQFAADALQWNIIEGLDVCNKKPIQILNAVFVGSFPSLYSDMFIKSGIWRHTDGALDIDVGFVNLYAIKNIFRALSLSQQIKKLLKSKDNRPGVIVSYSAHVPFLWAIKKAKKTCPDIATCLIVPDLPEYMNLSNRKSLLYRLLKYIENRFINSLLKNIDSFVLLTKHMAQPLKIGERPYIVIEGMVNPKDWVATSMVVKQISDAKSILYTGTLNVKYGILTLLEAFKLIKDESYHLWICGEGEGEYEIRRLSATDKRVKWFGRVTRDKALELQRQATVLINPRGAEGEFTKYSFPSKIMEYLLSGRPVIAYKLPGMPDCYDRNIFFIEGNTPEAMAAAIMEVCSKSASELTTFGNAAQQFVMNEKNNVKQAESIVELLRNLKQGK